MNCVVFLLFGFKPLGKGVLLIYVFIMAIFWRRLDVAYQALNLFFHLQITGVCYKITSPVTGKSTDLAFKFGNIVDLSLFDIDK